MAPGLPPMHRGPVISAVEWNPSRNGQKSWPHCSMSDKNHIFLSFLGARLSSSGLGQVEYENPNGEIDSDFELHRRGIQRCTSRLPARCSGLCPSDAAGDSGNFKTGSDG